MPEIHKARKRGQASTLQRTCVYCGREANIKGIASHERACKKKKEDLEKTRAFLDSRPASARDDAFRIALEHTNRALAEMNSDGNPIQYEGDALNPEMNVEINEHTLAVTPSSNIQPASLPIDPQTGQSMNKAIKIVYHPNSGRVEEIKTFDDYRCGMKARPLTKKEPWLPFRTRGDYEFAEISLAASLSVQQNNALISLIHRFIRGEAAFTILNNTDLQDKWKEASSKLTDFKDEEFDVRFKGESRTFKVYYRPIWDWILDLIKDVQLVSRMEWDAQKVFTYDVSSNSYVRFYDEPWTADRFWEVQSEFRHKETKALSIIFYADKNKLSSFGTQKGYPVVARCANLPVSIRNSDGLGGGMIVAWLPIVPENAADSGKVGFANFKASVWHRAVDIVLRSIRKKSKAGRWIMCGDGISRHICPHILIISADHEEQGIIALNRGQKGKKACTVCNHPTAKLANLSLNFSLRTAEDSKAYYELTKSFRTISSKEFILKLHGLRPVRNAFWKIGHTDVHRAISWDRLHAYHSGLFGHHFWPLFKSYFDKLGRSTEKKVDKRLSLFPTWRGLYHFDGALKVTFNDGRKYEDLSKQLFYVIHDIFERKADSHGYVFLRLFRKFLELDVYMSFDLQTENTILEAERALKTFGQVLLEYINLTGEFGSKNWNFMKAHTHKHACEDIRAKGVTRNYNTKPNEKLHGPLRDIYHERTNFRDVAPQILRVSHLNLVSTFVRSQLDILDHKIADSNAEDEAEDNFSESAAKEKRSHPVLIPPNDKFALGAQQPACTLANVEEDMKDDVAFKNFRKRLIIYLNNLFNVYNIPFPGGKYMKLKADDLIREFRFLKVYFESQVTWQMNTDYLRCSNKFFGKPRHDFILFNAGSKRCFARLVFMFAICIEGIAYPTALVQALDAYLGPPRLKDKELGLFRVGLKPRAAAEFIPIASIIRGALVVPVFEAGKENEYFVVDIIDGDMFLRCRDSSVNPNVNIQ